MKKCKLKKRMFGVILSLLLVMVCCVPVLAEEDTAEVIFPRYLDDAGLLSDKEADKLEEKLDQISEEHGCDVVIAVANTTDGEDIQTFTEDFYDYAGYGQGEEKNGIILLVGMEERQWYISTSGDAVSAFTDAGLDYISDDFTGYLGKEKYNKAFTKFANLSDKFLIQAEKGEPYDTGNMPKKSVSPFWIFADLVIGAVLAFIWGSAKKSKLKSVKKQVAAQEYTRPGSLNLTMNMDRFINRTVTSRVIQKNQSSGGGSSTHTSSSGNIHGGKGGSF